MTEDQLQASIVDYALWALKEPPDGPMWTAINPIPGKTKAVAGRSKRLGMMAGVPDLVFAWKSGRVFWIELKTQKGSLSPEQRTVEFWLNSLGHTHYVVRSIEDFQEALLLEGVPVKVRAA